MIEPAPPRRRKACSVLRNGDAAPMALVLCAMLGGWGLWVAVRTRDHIVTRDAFDALERLVVWLPLPPWWSVGLLSLLAALAWAQCILRPDLDRRIRIAAGLTHIGAWVTLALTVGGATLSWRSTGTYTYGALAVLATWSTLHILARD